MGQDERLQWFHLSQLAVEQLVRDGTVKPMEKEYIRKDGTRVPVLIGGALLDRENWRKRILRPRPDAAPPGGRAGHEVSLQMEHASH